jgi:CheY-like chemotaxis protein
VNQRVIGLFLKRMGLETGLAENGLEAVDLALNGKWEAVLMDCQLPGIDGIEATRRIRSHARGRTLPIIALTANASMENRTACFAAGMNDFLTKPVRVELLGAALRKWLPVATSPQSL